MDQPNPVYFVTAPNPEAKKNFFGQVIGLGILAGVGYYIYNEVKKLQGEEPPKAPGNYNEDYNKYPTN